MTWRFIGVGGWQGGWDWVGVWGGVGWGVVRVRVGERREDRIVSSNVTSKLLTFICPPLNSVGDGGIF